MKERKMINAVNEYGVMKKMSLTEFEHLCNLKFEYYVLCRDIGFRTAIHDWNFCKRAQAIQIFFGSYGLDAFKYGYDLGMYALNPYKPYKSLCNVFKGGAK